MEHARSSDSTPSLPLPRVRARRRRRPRSVRRRGRRDRAAAARARPDRHRRRASRRATPASSSPAAASRCAHGLSLRQHPGTHRQPLPRRDQGHRHQPGPADAQSRSRAATRSPSSSSSASSASSSSRSTSSTRPHEGRAALAARASERPASASPPHRRSTAASSSSATGRAVDVYHLLPGGGVDAGETLERRARARGPRGDRPRVSRSARRCSSTTPSTRTATRHVVNITFLAEVTGGAHHRRARGPARRGRRPGRPRVARRASTCGRRSRGASPRPRGEDFAIRRVSRLALVTEGS